MRDDYEKNRCFGKRDGLEKRLAMWANQLSHDPKYPWVGLGIIDDLKCACRELGGDPDKKYADMRNPKELPPEPKQSEPAQEYDL